MLKKITIGVLAIIAVGVIGFPFTTFHKVTFPTGSGIVAKQLCSLTFISGLPPERAKQLYLDPLIDDYAAVLGWEVDQESKSASATMFGTYRQTAVYREGLGCTLVTADLTSPDLTIPHPAPHLPLPLDANHRAAHFDEAALDVTLDQAFDDGTETLNTLAIAVLHKGRLVAHKYAEGIDPDTRLLGWSMTKSMTATLAGALTQTGTINVNEPARSMSAPDGRNPITLDHLIRMTSGLAIDEDNDGTDPNSDMLFTEGDMASFAASRKQRHAPGEHWDYMSGSTVLATRALQDTLGPDLETQIKTMRRLVFEPLNINTAVIEVDAHGTMVGSSYMFATAHEWARLAQLYLDDGRANNVQILPQGWRSYVATPTVVSGETKSYGAGFWLVGNSTDPQNQVFAMDGFQGQRAYIDPVNELVIVRLGATSFRDSKVDNLYKGVISALIAEEK